LSAISSESKWDLVQRRQLYWCATSHSSLAVSQSVAGAALYYDCLDPLEIIRHFGKKSFPIRLI
jgi:hypothetical protein